MAKILITDDAAFMRLMVRSALESKDHEISAANAGNPAMSISHPQASKIMDIFHLLPGSR